MVTAFGGQVASDMAHHKRPGLAATSTSPDSSSVSTNAKGSSTQLHQSQCHGSPARLYEQSRAIAKPASMTQQHEDGDEPYTQLAQAFQFARLDQIDQHTLAREQTSTAPSAFAVIRLFSTTIAHAESKRGSQQHCHVTAVRLLLPFHSPLASLARLVSADARLVSQPAASLLLHLHDWRVSGPN